MATETFDLYAVVRTASTGRRIIVRLSSQPNPEIRPNEAVVLFPNTVRVYSVVNAHTGETAHFKIVDGVERRATAAEIAAVRAIRSENLDGTHNYWALDAVDVRQPATDDEVEDVMVDPVRLQRAKAARRAAYVEEVGRLADDPLTPITLQPFFKKLRATF